MAKHLVVLKGKDGLIERYPMKEWLRRNPQFLPRGMSTANTSQQLRRGLQKGGWRLDIGDNEVLLIKTTSEGDASYAEGLAESSSNTAEEDELEAAAEITFGLERDLQTALRRNIEQLEPGLSIVDGGTERVTESGRIDITAADANGNVVVIELKAGVAGPEVIAQLLAYMGAVAQADRKPVRGLLVAGDFHDRVVWAARAVQNVQLKKYSFQFSFEEVN